MTNPTTDLVTRLNQMAAAGYAGWETAKEAAERLAWTENYVKACDNEVKRANQRRMETALELDAALMQLQGLKEESERLTAEAIRYRWLRSHLAGTIVQRFNPQEMDWRPEKMDALVDSRLHLVPPLDVAREHVESEHCWCKPTLDYTNSETGVKHWIHHEPN